MPHFVIAGKPDCALFNHARYVAEFISGRLSDFKINVIEIDKNKWKAWLMEINLKNKWYHSTSPVIWREFTLGGRPYFLGGLSEFWEYCYDYYALESLLPKEDLQRLVNDSMQYYTSKLKAVKDIKPFEKKKKIFVTGDKPKLVLLLLTQLLDLDEVFGDCELTICVLMQLDDSKTADKYFDGPIIVPSKFPYDIQLIDQLDDGLPNCELLIVTENLKKYKNEEFYKWLQRNFLFMSKLAEALNCYARKDIHVILAMDGPVCFNGAVLIDQLYEIDTKNIVALTADIGLETLDVVSRLTNVPIKDLGSPPVWGFIGINQIIDLDHIVQRCDVYRPNLRATKNKYGSTLRLGKNYTELRFLCYLSNNLPNVFREVQKKKSSVHLTLSCTQSNLAFCNYEKQNDELSLSIKYSKIRSVTSLLQNWYAPKMEGNILSLGILTNGSFGLPSGIFFSQPAHLKNGKWVPMELFPIPRKDPCGIDDLFPFIEEIYKYFQLSEKCDQY